MTSNPDGLRSLAKYSKLSVERIRYVPNADERVVQAITRGVLFQMAFWSGPAIQPFAKLTEVIAKLDPDGRIDLVAVDIDGSEALSAVSEFLGGVRGAACINCAFSDYSPYGHGLFGNMICFRANKAGYLALPAGKDFEKDAYFDVLATVSETV